jgi:predicted nucleotidyltransferase
MKAYKLSTEEKSEIKNRIASILELKEEISFAYLHGGFISAYWFRDVDVAVYIDDERIKREDALDYEIDLSIELEKEIRFPGDVKVLNYAPSSFRYEVTKGEVIFSREEELRFNFVERTWMTYFDYLPVEREAMRQILGE